MHVQAPITEFIIFAPCIMLASDVRNETIYSYLGLIMIHLYALLIHHYNRILANRKFPLVEKHQSKEEPKIDPYELKIIDLANNETWYRVGFTYAQYNNSIFLRPYFVSKSKAEEYKQSLEKLVDSVEGKAERALRIIELDKRNNS